MAAAVRQSCRHGNNKKNTMGIFRSGEEAAPPSGLEEVIESLQHQNQGQTAVCLLCFCALENKYL